jgi:hypothetical protein
LYSTGQVDLLGWAPQRPTPEGTALLGRIERIVRRGRVRGFIPLLITQRPAVLHKDVLSQADTLIAMKLTSEPGPRGSRGLDSEGQADREEGKCILADLPRLQPGERLPLGARAGGTATGALSGDPHFAAVLYVIMPFSGWFLIVKADLGRQRIGAHSPVHHSDLQDELNSDTR